MTQSPTNQPPTNYVSVRLTISDSQFERAQQSVFHDVPYIAYVHKGKNADNHHYHVLVIDTNVEKYRKRIKDNMGFSGNKFVSMKLQKNGLLLGIQYCAREGSEPILSHPELSPFIDAAPKWQQTTIAVRKLGEKCLKKDWQLTYTNLVWVAVEHARDHSLVDKSLKEVVRHLIQKTNWRPSNWLLKGGVPEFYENDFLTRLGKRKDVDMAWWTPRSI